jgi:hypothetical protein
MLNMEIFRTDGGGRTDNDERLTRVLIEVCKFEPDLVKKITLINDHKGNLMVKLIDDEMYLIAYYLFSYLWVKNHDYNVSIYVKNYCVIGYDEVGTYDGR